MIKRLGTKKEVQEVKQEKEKLIYIENYLADLLKRVEKLEEIKTKNEKK